MLYLKNILKIKIYLAKYFIICLLICSTCCAAKSKHITTANNPKKNHDPEIICTNPDSDPIFKDSNGKFSLYLVSHINHSNLKDLDQIITKIWINVVISSDGNLVNPVIIDWKTRQPKDITTLNPLEKNFLDYFEHFPKNKWIPAQKDGKPVATLMEIPIHIDCRIQ